jgi:hypothetical protein
VLSQQPAQFATVQLACVLPQPESTTPRIAARPKRMRLHISEEQQ